MNMTMEMFCELPVTDIGHVMKTIKVAERVEEHLKEQRKKKSEYYNKKKYETIKRKTDTDTMCVLV